MVKVSIFQNIKPEIVISATIIILSFLIYSQVKSHDFINFDDQIYVFQNDHVKSGLNRDSVKWAFRLSTDGKTYWHPLSWLSHMLDIEIFGLDAGYHHLSSVLLHILNSLLLFIVLKRMTTAPWRSGIVALLFAVHPVNVDSVAWIAERKNLLSTFFWFLTMLSYFSYSNKPRIIPYLITLIIFLLGLLSKPMLITLPFVLLLLDIWPLKRLQLPFITSSIGKATGDDAKKQKTWLLLLLEKLPFLALSVIIIGQCMFSLESGSMVASVESVPISLRISNALVSYFTYIWMLIWPKDLSIFYPFPDMIPAWKAACSGLFFLGITLTLMINIRLRPYYTIGWMWFVGTLVPVSGLVQAGLWPKVADRWLYVPQIGFFIFIVWFVTDITKNTMYKKQLGVMMVALVVSLLCMVSIKQLKYWKNTETLFSRALEIDPKNYIGHYILGVELYKKIKQMKQFTVFLNQSK